MIWLPCGGNNMSKNRLSACRNCLLLSGNRPFACGNRRSARRQWDLSPQQLPLSSPPKPLPIRKLTLQLWKSSLHAPLSALHVRKSMLHPPPKLLKARKFTGCGPAKHSSRPAIAPSAEETASSADEIGALPLRQISSRQETTAFSTAYVSPPRRFPPMDHFPERLRFGTWITNS